MAMQTFLVAFNSEFSQETSRSVQQRVSQYGGLILMVMKTGLIVFLEDTLVSQVESHPAVGMVGGVTLNPRGYAADRLQRIFAENLSKQLEFEKE